MSQSIKVEIAGKEPLELPVLKGTLGNEVVDIRTFTKGSGMFTFDPGFVSTASCESRLPLSTAIKVISIIAGIRLSSLQNKVIIGDLLPFDLWRTA